VGIALTYCSDVALAQLHGGERAASGEDPYRLTDVYLPPQVDTFPPRPRPILELGDGFLKPGNVQNPIRIPTGALWSPSLTVWGEFRTGVSAIDTDAAPGRSEWANRFDLFAEARVSPTERLVLGLRPFDKRGRFSGYDLDAGEWIDAFNTDVRTAFIEGDFGEIFPALDRSDKRALDYGFGIGRQPLFFQDGVMLNDIVDAITITRNSVRWNGVSNFRLTALAAFNDIDRGNTITDDDATLVGLLTATDFEHGLVEVDLLATFSDNPRGGDAVYLGVGSTQRIGAMNSTFRANASLALDDPRPAADDGILLTSVLSWVPHHTHDNFYVGTFLGIDNFTSASRGPATGGPLGNIGILFAATGLGTVGAPIRAAGADVVGGAVGYQQLFNHGRSQMIYEVGVRAATDSREDNTIAGGARYRRAMGQRAEWTLDAFAGNDEVIDTFYGGRIEFSWRF